ncbi:hypothetical protein PFICI_06956 [Pestalotiopsis fici W106-1]|uniref:F-box domain-containing protein n=1 Tax=Pestalotiopsis fici (strain W106-1 / CGMCC3.15140) TaxID=1229662 RepID=W3X7E6_PESFW|nr:uncharacterized protein PFICI_06956 [Pestalotiopsis fici W106-1]ETS81954.1 hypothetical protein PFICI_06956 [Pestalotiopsis fici W106-1]
MGGQYFRFFDLPGELRTAILEHLVVMDSDIPIFAMRETCVQSSPMLLTDLLLVCHQMNREASGLFYTQNKFIVNLGSRRMYSEITQDGQLFSPEVMDARRRIRSLSLRMRRISGDFERLVVPAVKDMILNGSLRVLDVGILAQDTSAQKTVVCDLRPHSVSRDLGAASVVKTTPFQALLQLLVDPDLEQVTLWVSLIHWSLWCPYHSTIKKHAKLDSYKDGVSIDWRRLVEDFSDGSSITKVQRPRFA